MTKDEYLSARNKIEELYTSARLFELHGGLAAKCCLVGASLSNYLPSLPYTRHGEIFRQVMMNQQLSILEQAYPPSLDYVTCEWADNTAFDLMREPCIICTSHTGSYRIINLFLLAHQIPYSLVVSNEVSRTQGALFKELFTKFTNGKTGGFGIIDAETSSAAIGMLRQLKGGKSLLVYIDGNTGTGDPEKDNANICEVSFLCQMIRARTGAAFLAHTAGIPLINVDCVRPATEDIRLIFRKPIVPIPGQERSVFAAGATRQLYGYLSGTVEKYPGQWEGWLYLHKSASIVHPYIPSNPPHETDKNRRLQFNHKLYSLFMIGNNCYLLNKNTYKSYQLSTNIYRVLKKYADGPAKALQLKKAILDLFCDRYVLVPP